MIACLAVCDTYMDRDTPMVYGGIAGTESRREDISDTETT